MFRKRWLFAGLTSTALFASSLSVGVVPASAHTCPVDEHTVTLRPYMPGDTHVELCHGTGSATNPYVIIDPNVNGACGHYREHLVDRPAGSNQNQDVFPDAFLAAAPTLCA